MKRKLIAVLLMATMAWGDTRTRGGSLIVQTSDIPPAVIAAIDNSLVSGPVDANGFPNHLATAASTALLPINGGTTSLSMWIAGKQMTLNTNVTTTLTTGVNYIYALGDTSNANLVAGDFIASLIPLSYSYVAPACSNGANVANGVGGFFAAASASVPHYWFNLSTNQMNICTSSGGSFTATSYGGANAPALLIGVAYYDGTSIQAVAPMPFGASPIRISQNFGTGSDGAVQITSAGTTTRDGYQQLTGLDVITGTLTATAFSTRAATGVIAYSQNPVIVWNGTITASGLGVTTAAAGTGTGAAGTAGGFGGGGGGGGGSGTTSAAGGAGGNHSVPLSISFSSGGGTAGAITPTAGGAGNAFNFSLASPGNVPLFRDYMIGGSGGSGGNGAGDATNNGGTGGAGGATVYIKAPSVSVSGTGIIKADGSAGGNAAGGNAAAGGGGGGGLCVVSRFVSYGIVVGTNVTAAGGASGNKAGTGQLGGIGGTGIAADIRLQ